MNAADAARGPEGPGTSGAAESRRRVRALDLGAYIQELCGIKAPPSKRTMIEARLQKRLRALELDSLEDYCALLADPVAAQAETPHLIDAITTNTTAFFREPGHFDHLARVLLPAWTKKAANAHPFRIWSAGCSSGEEPYTLAMVLSEHAMTAPGFQFSILATDICGEVLARARRAVYPEERVQAAPGALLKRYALRSRDRAAGLIRMAPELREKVEFRLLNLMEDFSMREPLDAIFCRNVMIYFDRPTQDRLLRKFCRQLAPGGHLFIGHSESLAGLFLPLDQVSPTIYRLKG